MAPPMRAPIGAKAEINTTMGVDTEDVAIMNTKADRRHRILP